MKQQTAVQWLISNLINPNRSISDWEVIEQAKAIEKEQITDAYTMGSYDMAEKVFKPEQYYNETYKTNTNED